MRPTVQEILIAVRRLSVIPYFPSDEYAREAIMVDLQAFVHDVDALSWLVPTAIAHLHSWQGCAALRALHNTRYKPADGIEGGSSSIKGFTPEDNEGRPALAAGTRRYLPAPDDSEITDEERRQIDALDKKIKLRTARP